MALKVGKGDIITLKDENNKESIPNALPIKGREVRFGV